MAERVTLALALALACTPRGAPPSEGFELRLPIACEPGENCFVQNYVDLDPGPAARDYRCGPRTYDAHRGTDFRLRDLAAMRAGVDVLASARGTVKATRDGEPDHRLREGERAPGGLECGNGVVVDHGGGWETQLCHLAIGSVRVRPGEAVEAGTVLGQVGLSGFTQFPHVHLSVRRGGIDVDPFAPNTGPGACEGDTPLWTEDVARSLDYRRGVLLQAGFAPAMLTPDDVEDGLVVAPDRASPAIVAWAYAIGLEPGDVQEIRLLTPSGEELARYTQPPLPRAKATALVMAGKRNRSGPIEPGVWSLRYRLTRGGAVVIDERRSIAL